MGTTLENLGRKFGAKATLRAVPKDPETPTEDIRLEEESALRDLRERRMRQQGRSQSNLRIPNFAKSIRTQRPGLGATLG